MVVSAQYDLLQLSPKAGRAIGELIDDPETPAHVRLKASTELWDRIGVRGGVDLNVHTEITVNPSEEIARRLDAMRDSLLASRENGSLPPAAEDTIESYVVSDDQLAFEDDGDEHS
jgi:hypothetical protein